MTTMPSPTETSGCPTSPAGLRPLSPRDYTLPERDGALELNALRESA